MRVVSLLPAGTEIVAALGAFEHLVGVTHECDHPAAVISRARVTTSAIDAARDAGAVDAQVRANSAAGAPLFALDATRIAALRPDLILTQALCDVCAVSETDVRALAVRLTPVPRVVTLAAATIDGVLDDIARVAAALSLDDEAEELLAGLRARLRRVHETLKSAGAPRPRVAVIEWTDPVYAAGHWVPEMVRKAGGIDVVATAGAHSVTVDVDAVRSADPEVLFVSPCGYDVARAARAAEWLLARPEWAWARGRRIWALDANGIVSRPGPRLVDGIETMAAAMHPELFPAPLSEHARDLTRATILRPVAV